MYLILEDYDNDWTILEIINNLSGAINKFLIHVFDAHGYGPDDTYSLHLIEVLDDNETFKKDDTINMVEFYKNVRNKEIMSSVPFDEMMDLEDCVVFNNLTELTPEIVAEYFDCDIEFVKKEYPIDNFNEYLNNKRGL